MQTRLRPSDAYAYASGEPVGLPPFDAQGEPTREIALERPLDFAAVTDHAEFLGETEICTNAVSLSKRYWSISWKLQYPRKSINVSDFTVKMN